MSTRQTVIFRTSITVLSIFLIVSCSNSLWYSGVDTANLSLRLQLPTTSLNTGSSRALALQGKSIFVEIADIQDVAAYMDPNVDEDTSDSLFYEIPDGDGNWVNTPWGGHAVVHASALGTGEVTIAFNGVPRDRDLLIRVIQDTDRTLIENAMADTGSGYGIEWYPISQTYNPGGSGPWEDMGVTLTSVQLSSGVVVVPIRPQPTTMVEYTSFSEASNMNFVVNDPPSEPPLGETRFTTVNLDMDFGEIPDNTVDPGLLVGYKITMVSGSPIPGIVAMYDSEGRQIGPSVVHTSTSGMTTTFTSYSVVKVDLTDAIGATNDEYFFGATLIPGVNLSVGNPLYTSFDVVAKPMVNGYIDSYYLPYVGTISPHRLRWGWPDMNGIQIFEPGDLEFQVLHWYGPEAPPPNIKDMDAVLALNPDIIMDWSAATAFHSPGDGWEYEIPDITALPGVDLNPVDLDNYIIIVLARLPGGTPFLIAAYTGIYNLWPLD